MTKRVLISGQPARIESLAKQFQVSDVESVAFSPEMAAVDYYVQLGVVVPARGDTIVQRVQSFLNDGLLERFTLAGRVLPKLSDGAVILLVAGNTASEVAAPDDRDARLSLLRVLAHAIRADAAPRRIRVRVISGERTDAEITDFAITGAKDPDVVSDVPTGEGGPEERYEDWRIQIMGLAQVEV